MTLPTVETLRTAAIEHAALPINLRTGMRDGSPLYDLIPDADVPDWVRERVEDVIDTTVSLREPERARDMPFWMAARCRSALHRWAVREHWDTVRYLRGEIEAREMWKAVTS